MDPVNRVLWVSPPFPPFPSRADMERWIDRTCDVQDPLDVPLSSRIDEERKPLPLEKIRERCGRTWRERLHLH